MQFSRPSEGVICSLPRSVKFPTWNNFTWAAALYIPSIGQNHAWLMWKSLSRVVECTNYNPENWAWSGKTTKGRISLQAA